jgi:hypothetical protein
MPVALAPAAAASAYQLGSGIVTAINNRRPRRPKYQIDAGYQRNVDDLSNQAYGDNGAFSASKAALNEQTADSVNAANQLSGNNTSSAIGSLNNLITSKNAAQRNLNQDQTQYQANMLGQLGQARQALGEERDKAFDYNENQPFQNALAEYRDKKKQSNQQIQGGLNNFASAAALMLKKGARRITVKG